MTNALTCEPHDVFHYIPENGDWLLGHGVNLLPWAECVPGRRMSPTFLNAAGLRGIAFHKDTSPGYNRLYTKGTDLTPQQIDWLTKSFIDAGPKVWLYRMMRGYGTAYLDVPGRIRPLQVPSNGFIPWCRQNGIKVERGAFDRWMLFPEGNQDVHLILKWA